MGHLIEYVYFHRIKCETIFWFLKTDLSVFSWTSYPCSCGISKKESDQHGRQWPQRRWRSLPEVGWQCRWREGNCSRQPHAWECKQSQQGGHSWAQDQLHCPQCKSYWPLEHLGVVGQQASVCSPAHLMSVRPLSVQGGLWVSPRHLLSFRLCRRLRSGKTSQPKRRENHMMAARTGSHTHRALGLRLPVGLGWGFMLCIQSSHSEELRLPLFCVPGTVLGSFSCIN